MKTPSTLRIALVLLVAMTLVGGCKSQSAHHDNPATVHQLKLAKPVAPRGLAMFDTQSQNRLSWSQLLNTLSYSDVIIVVADNSDPAALSVEQALVEDMLASHNDAALTVSFLERHEQGVIDSYLNDEVDADTLAIETYSDQRFGDHWDNYMLPMVDAAKRNDRRVYGANAREKYVRLARRDGYAALQAAPAGDQNDFSMPRRASAEERKDYGQVVSDSLAGAEAVQEPVDPDWLDNLYFAQLVRNQTMADTIRAAARAGHDPVIHLNGTIHPEFKGGTPWLFGAQHPFTDVVTVTILPVDSRRIRPQDRDRGDIVIYTSPTEMAGQ